MTKKIEDMCEDLLANEEKTELKPILGGCASGYEV